MHHEVPPAATPAAFDVGARSIMQRLMPVAPNVPGESHHLVPPPRPAGETAPAAYVEPGPDALLCPHSGTPCPALTRLFGNRPIASETAQDWARKLAPCSSCRVDFEAQRSALRGLRLGQREREVLLGAAGSDIYIVTEAGMSRSLSAARRRAAQFRSSRPGWFRRRPTPRRQGPDASRSKPCQGSSVPDAPWPICHGRVRPLHPRREAGALDAAGGRVALPGKEPSQLIDETVARTQAALKDTLNDLKRALVAALRPVRDRDTLDAVTRHLERKVEGLKELLEARAHGLKARPAREIYPPVAGQPCRA